MIQPFETPLLLQSIVMIVVQLLLLNVCVELRRSSGPPKRFLGAWWLHRRLAEGSCEVDGQTCAERTFGSGRRLATT
jgi:hypothetical protein